MLDRGHGSSSNHQFHLTPRHRAPLPGGVCGQPFTRAACELGRSYSPFGLRDGPYGALVLLAVDSISGDGTSKQRHEAGDLGGVVRQRSDQSAGSVRTSFGVLPIEALDGLPRLWFRGQSGNRVDVS